MRRTKNSPASFQPWGTMRLYMKMTMKAKAAVYLAWRSGTCCTVALLHCSKFILHCMKGRGAPDGVFDRIGRSAPRRTFPGTATVPVILLFLVQSPVTIAHVSSLLAALLSQIHAVASIVCIVSCIPITSQKRPFLRQFVLRQYLIRALVFKSVPMGLPPTAASSSRYPRARGCGSATHTVR